MSSARGAMYVSTRTAGLKLREHARRFNLTSSLLETFCVIAMSAASPALRSILSCENGVNNNEETRKAKAVPA